MKKIIRNFTMALAALFMVSVTAMADDDKPIEFSQLPQAAQTTVKKEFPSHQIAFTTQEGILSKTYTFIPAAIDKFVKAKYPNTFIKKIDKDRRDTEIELSNGLDLKFNKNYKLIEIDD